LAGNCKHAVLAIQTSWQRQLFPSINLD